MNSMLVRFRNLNLALRLSLGLFLGHVAGGATLPPTSGPDASVSLTGSNAKAGDAISAVFSAGVLTVTGDSQGNTLTVSRDVAGAIFVNGGALPVTGGVPTIANTTLIRMLGLGGNDTLVVDHANGLMPPAHLLGGDGDDTLTGSANDDVLEGGAGNDTLLGRQGNDRLLGGAGNDILNGGTGSDEIVGDKGDDQIVWFPGDGSDRIEGDGGQDTLTFHAANIGEIIDLSANGKRLRFFRNIGNATLDCSGVERVIVRALGGADQVSINDLSGTDVRNVIVDLSGSVGGGDGQEDTIFVHGTEGKDQIAVAGSINGVDVLGLTAAVTVVGAEPGLDELVINARGGDDVVDASAVQAGAIDLSLNGGAGNDELIGGAGNDLLIGGPGSDVASGGAGDDTFAWNPGDGSDVFEGGVGYDALLCHGANVAEKVDITANGERMRFTRDVSNVAMDCGGIEEVRFHALGGADTITVNDLSGTSVTKVALHLAGPIGPGDSEADTVIVYGSNGDDVVIVAGDATGVSVQGLAAMVSIVGSESALDQLSVRMLAGEDVVEASALQAGVIQLTCDGGLGSDVLIGSAGPDVLIGGDGDDVLIGGPGVDVLDGGLGSNILLQD
jgi:Ca2+-binding RTX toxin-like protein